MSNRILPVFFTVSLFFISMISVPAAAVPAEIQATTISGEKVTIPQIGKKTAVHFWTSWCPPCKEELPQFQKFYEENRNQVQLVTINLTSQEQSEKSVRQFLKKHDLTQPVVLDSNGKLMNLYRIVTIPTTYLYNEHGELEKVIVGPMTTDQLRSWSNN